MVELLNPEFEGDLTNQPTLVNTEALAETREEQFQNDSDTALGESVEQNQPLIFDKKRLEKLFQKMRKASDILKNIYSLFMAFSKVSWIAKYILYLLTFVVFGLISLCGYALVKAILYLCKGLKWCFTVKYNQLENSINETAQPESTLPIG